MSNTNKNKPNILYKNPLLTSTLTVDDFMKDAVLLRPALQPLGKEDETNQNNFVLAPSAGSSRGDIKTDADNIFVTKTPQSIGQNEQLIDKNENFRDVNLANEDDFDFASYYARLHSIPDVSATAVKQPAPSNMNQGNNDDFSEIDLCANSTEYDYDNVNENHTYAADLASNLSQLPNVLPHVANTVFSSFSNIWNNRNKTKAEESISERNVVSNFEPVEEDEGRYNKEIPEQAIVPIPFLDATNFQTHSRKNSATLQGPMIDATAKENVHNLLEPKIDSETLQETGLANVFRISSSKSKKMYARVPGLTLGETEYPSLKSSAQLSGIHLPPMPEQNHQNSSLNLPPLVPISRSEPVLVANVSSDTVDKPIPAVRSVDMFAPQALPIQNVELSSTIPVDIQNFSSLNPVEQSKISSFPDGLDPSKQIPQPSLPPKIPLLANDAMKKSSYNPRSFFKMLKKNSPLSGSGPHSQETTENFTLNSPYPEFNQSQQTSPLIFNPLEQISTESIETRKVDSENKPPVTVFDAANINSNTPGRMMDLTSSVLAPAKEKVSDYSKDSQIGPSLLADNSLQSTDFKQSPAYDNVFPASSVHSDVSDHAQNLLKPSLNVNLPPCVPPPSGSAENKFRLNTKKRLQYYAGPISGDLMQPQMCQNSSMQSSNSLNFPSMVNTDIITKPNLFTPMDTNAEEQNANSSAFNKTQTNANQDTRNNNVIPFIQNASHAIPQDIQIFTPSANETRSHTPVSFNKPEIYSPERLPYLPPNPTKTYHMLENQHNDSGMDAITTVQSDNERKNDVDNEVSNFGFGFKALEKIQQKVNLNKLQNAVTSFFDPNYYESQKKIETSKFDNDNLENFTIHTSNHYDNLAGDGHSNFNQINNPLPYESGTGNMFPQAMAPLPAMPSNNTSFPLFSVDSNQHGNFAPDANVANSTWGNNSVQTYAQTNSNNDGIEFNTNPQSQFEVSTNVNEFSVIQDNDTTTNSSGENLICSDTESSVSLTSTIQELMAETNAKLENAQNKEKEGNVTTLPIIQNLVSESNDNAVSFFDITKDSISEIASSVKDLSVVNTDYPQFYSEPVKGLSSAEKVINFTENIDDTLSFNEVTKNLNEDDASRNILDKINFSNNQAVNVHSNVDLNPPNVLSHGKVASAAKSIHNVINLGDARSFFDDSILSQNVVENITTAEQTPKNSLQFFKFSMFDADISRESNFADNVKNTQHIDNAIIDKNTSQDVSKDLSVESSKDFFDYAMADPNVQKNTDENCNFSDSIQSSDGFLDDSLSGEMLQCDNSALFKDSTSFDNPVQDISNEPKDRGLIYSQDSLPLINPGVSCTGEYYEDQHNIWGFKNFETKEKSEAFYTAGSGNSSENEDAENLLDKESSFYYRPIVEENNMNSEGDSIQNANISDCSEDPEESVEIEYETLDNSFGSFTDEFLNEVAQMIDDTENTVDLDGAKNTDLKSDRNFYEDCANLNDFDNKLIHSNKNDNLRIDNIGEIDSQRIKAIMKNMDITVSKYAAKKSSTVNESTADEDFTNPICETQEEDENQTHNYSSCLRTGNHSASAFVPFTEYKLPSFENAFVQTNSQTLSDQIDDTSERDRNKSVFKFYDLESREIHLCDNKSNNTDEATYPVKFISLHSSNVKSDETCSETSDEEIRNLVNDQSYHSDSNIENVGSHNEVFDKGNCNIDKFLNDFDSMKVKDPNVAELSDNNCRNVDREPESNVEIEDLENSNTINVKHDVAGNDWNDAIEEKTECLNGRDLNNPTDNIRQDFGMHFINDFQNIPDVKTDNSQNMICDYVDDSKQKDMDSLIDNNQDGEFATNNDVKVEESFDSKTNSIKDDDYKTDVPLFSAFKSTFEDTESFSFGKLTESEPLGKTNKHIKKSVDTMYSKPVCVTQPYSMNVSQKKLTNQTNTSVGQDLSANQNNPSLIQNTSHSVQQNMFPTYPPNSESHLVYSNVFISPLTNVQTFQISSQPMNSSAFNSFTPMNTHSQVYQNVPNMQQHNYLPQFSFNPGQLPPNFNFPNNQHIQQNLPNLDQNSK